jgi:hypothetical protein
MSLNEYVAIYWPVSKDFKQGLYARSRPIMNYLYENIY